METAEIRGPYTRFYGEDCADGSRTVEVREVGDNEGASEGGHWFRRMTSPPFHPHRAGEWMEVGGVGWEGLWPNQIDVGVEDECGEVPLSSEESNRRARLYEAAWGKPWVPSHG